MGFRRTVGTCSTRGVITTGGGRIADIALHVVMSNSINSKRELEARSIAPRCFHWKSRATNEGRPQEQEKRLENKETHRVIPISVCRLDALIEVVQLSERSLEPLQFCGRDDAVAAGEGAVRLGLVHVLKHADPVSE